MIVRRVVHRAPGIAQNGPVRTTLLCLVLFACADTQYAFVAQSLPMSNPATGGKLADGEATAVDGFTKHKWVSYDDSETCFDSRLSDLRADDISMKRPFELLGFKDKAQRLDTVARIASSKIVIKGSGQEKIETEERAMAFPHVDVEVCFANPSRVITPSTSFVVLKVPYSADSEAAGSSGSRDGVWRLAR
jgi:hypothetical protein